MPAKATRGSKRAVNHTCFNSVNDGIPAHFAGLRQVFEDAELFVDPEGQGRVLRTARRPRVRLTRALPLCLVLGMAAAPAAAQSLTGDLFNPAPGGFVPKQSPLDAVAQAGPGQPGAAPEDQGPSMPASALPRFGAPQTYGNPAGSGAADTGYDSLGRKKPARAKPGARPSTAPGVAGKAGPNGTAPPLVNNATLPPPQRGPVPSGPPKVTPPSSATANFAPVSAAQAGSIVGAPPRRRLKTDDDPFGAPGIYYGSFLSKAAVELSGGYDTNPARLLPPRGSAFYVIAPELLVTSNWERHSVVVDLRGSYTGYGSTIPTDISSFTGAPTSLDRPDFTGKIDGRIDVTHDTRILSELRLRLGTDNPGSPNIQAGLARFPVYATSGATLGVDHDFNRVNVAVSGTVDHTSYQWSKLNDGTTTSNDDRDFTQFGGIGRVSYDLRPGLKPFVEVEGDTRVHDQPIDRYGYARDSDGGYIKGGTSFELTRLITGEAAVGWTERSYQDQRLGAISGLLTSASLIWTVTPLTTAKFTATSSIDESPLAGVPGVLTHDYVWQVEHTLRRWLVVTARFGYGTNDYEGLGRFDNRFTTSADLVYKLTRNLQIKGQIRHDWLESNFPGVSTQATVVMLGVRVQQ